MQDRVAVHLPMACLPATRAFQLHVCGGDSVICDARQVEYEETGWYDGQVFVKPPEVLARDRLLGSYEVRSEGCDAASGSLSPACHNRCLAEVIGSSNRGSDACSSDARGYSQKHRHPTCYALHWTLDTSAATRQEDALAMMTRSELIIGYATLLRSSPCWRC